MQYPIATNWIVHLLLYVVLAIYFYQSCFPMAVVSIMGNAVSFIVYLELRGSSVG